MHFSVLSYNSSRNDRWAMPWSDPLATGLGGRDPPPPLRFLPQPSSVTQPSFCAINHALLRRALSDETCFPRLFWYCCGCNELASRWVRTFEMLAGRGVLHQAPSHLNPKNAATLHQFCAFSFNSVRPVKSVSRFPFGAHGFTFVSLKYGVDVDAFVSAQESRQHVKLLCVR